ncbi:MAG: sialate O-acetylesterase [Planctomycetes bacterium]|nr:sialate O-acetylesterase [Planctomycetota bacterium]
MFSIVFLLSSAVLFYLLTSSFAANGLRLPNVFGDGMVLQRGQDLPVWGEAAPGQEVEVSLCGQKRTTETDANGKWSLTLNPLPAGGPHEMVVRGGEIVRFKNVLIGEVWICSGQSNMGWPLEAIINARQEIARADLPDVRLLPVPQVTADEAQFDVDCAWSVCKPESARTFSAVGYLFGRTLHQKLDVPVGLIDSSWGGTTAEAWTSRKTLESDPDFRPVLERWDKTLAAYPEAQKEHEKKRQLWEQACEKAREQGKPLPPAPPAPPGPESPHPSALYNAMLAPIFPYGIRGAIWYQGESNGDRGYQYRKLLPAMIQDWRAAWGQGDFPFHYVQLPNYLEVNDGPVESEWAEVREAQLMTLDLPNTEMAVTIDLGEADDLHPPNKLPVAERLARTALSKVYGRPIVATGPIYNSMSIEGAQIRIGFRRTGSGLTSRGGGPLKTFTIAGENQNFVNAEACIEGETVVVSSRKVDDPVAVRYAWADNPPCNLYNREGLPATPFRTDDWPGVSVERL